MEPEIVLMINEIKKRKSDALAKVMDLYMNSVYHLAKSILYVIASEEDIEECVQDTFLAVWEEIDKYNPDRGTFKTWILVLCKYKALTRKQLLQKNLVQTELDESQLSSEQSPEDAFLIREGTSQILNAMNNLNEVDREIFIRRYLLEQSFNEIKDIMKLSRQAIDNRLWRGRKYLKDVLKSKEGGVSDEETR